MKRKSSGSSSSSKRPRSSNYAPPLSSVKRPGKRAYQPRQRMGEVKGVDVSIDATGVLATTGTNGNIILLNGVPPGSASYNRIGRKVFCKSVRVFGQLEVVSTPATTTSNMLGQVVRGVLVWDKQPSSGSIPTFETIFGVTAQDGTESSSVLAPLRYDNMDRFKILKDTCIDQNPGNNADGAAASAVNDIRSFDEYYSFKKGKYESTYGSTTNPMTITDVSTGALYLVFRAQTNTGGDATVQVLSNSFARFRYTD